MPSPSSTPNRNPIRFIEGKASISRSAPNPTDKSVVKRYPATRKRYNFWKPCDPPNGDLSGYEDQCEFAARGSMPAVSLYWSDSIQGNAWLPLGMTAEEVRKTSGQGAA